MRVSMIAALVLVLAFPVLAEPQPEPADTGTLVTLTQKLQGRSGVSIQTMCTNCNNADLSVSGLSNEHISLTCDDLPVSSELARIYMLAVMPPTVFDKVAVQRGAGRAELEAGAVGGEIEIRRRVPQQGVQLNAAVDTGSEGWSGTRVDLSGREGWFGGQFVGSWAESDAIFADDDANADLAGFDRYTLDGRLDLRFNEQHNLRLGGVYYDEIQVGGPAAWRSEFERRLENVDFDREQYDALYEASFDGGSRVRVGASWSDREADIEETLFGPGSQFTPTYFISEQNLHATASWSRPLGSSGTFRLGGLWDRLRFSVVDVRYNQLRSSIPFSERLTFAQGETVHERGGWAEAEFFLGKADLSVGLRYVDYTYRDGEDRAAWLALPLPQGTRLLPRASVTFSPTDPLRLRFSVGGGYRLPDPTYEEVCCGREFRGNRGINIEESWNYGVEATYQPRPELQLIGSAFLTDFDELIVHMATLSFQHNPTYQNVNIPEARYLSAGLQLRYEASPVVTIRGSYSWLDTENRTPGDEIPALIDFFNSPLEITIINDEVPFVAERNATVGLDLSLRRWGLVLNIDAQNTGSLAIQQYDLTTFEPTTGSDTIRFIPTESFWLVNLRATKTLPGGVNLYVGVDNIDDYIQSDLGDWSTDYTWGPQRGRYVYGGVSFRLG